LGKDINIDEEEDITMVIS